MGWEDRVRVVLSTYGSRGDVEPMVALAVRLQHLGAEVRLCAPPDFAALLERAGVPLTPFGWPIRELATAAVTGTAPKTLPEIAADLAAMTCEAVLAGAEYGGVVVATGSLPSVAGAQAAAERVETPFRFATFSPCYLPSPHHPPVAWPGQALPEHGADNPVLWDANAEHLDAVFGETINAQRGSIGLPRIDNVRDRLQTDHPFLAADAVLGPWPRSADLEVVQTGAWILADERPLAAALEAFLDAGAPPVFVGFGSRPLREAGEVARVVIEAVRAQGQRVVLGSGWAGLAALDEESDCMVVDEENQQALFRRVAVVVHHGGAGTTTTAARAGTPQVVVPQAADQPYWANRVAAMGIGVAHEGSMPTVDSLSDALGVALQLETRRRATSVAGTIRSDGVEVAAEVLLDTLTK